MTRARHNTSAIRARQRSMAAGFTLVELMVAVSGGLFVSIMLFVLARDGSRFYQREARVADATMAGMLGFERLRNEISRAGYMGSPNIFRDPRVCEPRPQLGELQDLASLRIEPDTPSPNPIMSEAGLSPDTITLSGSYSSVEEFPLLGVIANGGAGFSVELQRAVGASARLGLTGQDDAVDQAILAPYFQADRALRITDQGGKLHFGYVHSFSVSGGVPTIVLTAASAIRVRTAGSQGACSLSHPHTGGGVNVLNIVRYSVRSLRGDSRYAPLYNEPDPRGWDAQRTELVREELYAPSLEVIPQSAELVAEYAVNLEFAVTLVDGRDPNGAPTSLRRIETAQALSTELGRVNGNLIATPERARMVRVRLSVRSREADRRAGIAPGPTVADGLYRIALGPNGDPPFARVRTLQADVTLHNHVGLDWP